MSKMPWFRFYSEALHDRKLVRITRMTGQPKASIMGVWLILLCLANDSPERGRLMISDDLWLTEDEIMAETGLDPVTYGKIIHAFQQLNMLSISKGYELLNWDSRQFKSDHSTPRVQKHRAKKQDETLQKRSGNVIEQNRTDTESETETDSENGGPPSRIQLPTYLASQELMEAWDKWLDHHEEKGSPLTKGAALQQFEDFKTWGPERSIAAIKWSIRNNYTGLVEPSNNGGRPSNLDKSMAAIRSFMENDDG